MYKNGISSPTTRSAAALPWDNDCVLVVLQLEGEGVLLGVLGGGDAHAGLRLFYVLHELKVQVQCVGVPDWEEENAKVKSAQGQNRKRHQLILLLPTRCHRSADALFPHRR